MAGLRIAVLETMQRLKVCLIAVIVIHAQPHPALAVNEQFTEAQARDALTLALKNIHRSFCSEKPCEPATEDELRSPPLSIKDAQKVMTIGLLSGVAERCGLDWSQNFFVPLMWHFRHVVRMNNRQLALIAMLHGMEQGAAFKLATDDMCTPELKGRLSKSVPL